MPRMSETPREDNLVVRTTVRDAWSIRELRFYLWSRFSFIMAIRMSLTILGWWVYQLTSNPLTFGMIGLAEVVGALSFALYAGHVVDRKENKKIILVSIIAYAVCVLGFFIFSDAYIMEQVGRNGITAFVLGVLFFTGIIRAFSGPAFSATLSRMVPRSHLPSATALSTGTWLIASVTGHALGGFFIAWLGIHDSFLIVLALCLVAWLNILALKARPLVQATSQRTWESVREGIRYVFSNKDILGAMSVDLFAVLFGGVVALVPVFAKDILFTDAIGFGWLNAAADIGSIITVGLLAVFPFQQKQGRIMLYAVAGFGVCMILFALSTHYWLSFIALFAGGSFDGISMVIRGTILQLRTPDALRGRVMSVNSMFINSSNELGQFESGLAARMMGVVPSVVFGGCMTLLVVLITWVKAPSLRKMEYRS